MATNADAPLDVLWKEYSLGFRDFDDLTLARWLAQTLGQIAGKSWRSRTRCWALTGLAAQMGHERQIWLMRLVATPHTYSESPCCRAPMLPLLTRDVHEIGLVCQHCNETLVPFDDIPAALQGELKAAALEYAPVHAVAHWDDRQRKAAGDYDHAVDKAAEEAEDLLAKAGRELAPRLLESYAAVIWEDQDECLEVRPEDVRL